MSAWHTEAQRQATARRRFQRTFYLHKGGARTVSRGYGQIINGDSTTISTVAAQNTDNGITITSEATSAPNWSALLTATNTGNHTFEVKCTFADGQIDVAEFQVIVNDPTVAAGSEYDYGR